MIVTINDNQLVGVYSSDALIFLALSYCIFFCIVKRRGQEPNNLSNKRAIYPHTTKGAYILVKVKYFYKIWTSIKIEVEMSWEAMENNKLSFISFGPLLHFSASEIRIQFKFIGDTYY